MKCREAQRRKGIEIKWGRTNESTFKEADEKQITKREELWRNGD